MARLSLYLLGPFQAALDGEAIAHFATDKVRALLAYLAVEGDMAHRRDALAGLLWADYPQKRARQSLRQTLSYLRQALGEEDLARPFLQATRETIQLDPQGEVWSDVAAFTALVDACRGHRHRRLTGCRTCMQRFAEAVVLFGGDFMAHFFLGDSAPFDEWILLNREWLHRQAVEALSHLAPYHERRGAYGLAREYAWRLVELEPWHEEAHRQLMRLLAISGQRGAALAQYESCRRVLAEELGVEPTSETVHLYEQIRQDSEIVSLAPLHNLPPASTSFVGREGELAELADYLADPDCRLVTLVGPGGIGKTRLALQVAEQQLGSFAHGVFYVPLASIDTAEFVVPALVDALPFSLQGGQDPAEQLIDYLREKEVLLVLDTMEHLLEEGTSLLAEILSSVPGVVLLVTSRERLNLQEEWVYELTGLTCPDAEGPVRLPGQYSAVELFVQRGRQVRSSFAPSPAEMSSIVRICHLVEGMPLAIELAVASLGVRTCQEIAQQIEQNLGVLHTFLRNVPERHRSMRATLDYSWDLLSEEERAAFSRLAVFQGGFRQEAAGEILDLSPAFLQALQHKSLLRRTFSGRWQIQPLLHQYAAEKLDLVPAQKGGAFEQHARYYAQFLHQRRTCLRGGRQRQAVEEVQGEIGNVRSAWRWAVAQIETGVGLGRAAAVLRQSVESLYLFYTFKGAYQEGRGLVGQAAAVLARAPASADLPEEERDLLLGLLWAYEGRFCEFTEHADTAEQLFERSLQIFHRLGARRERALPLRGLGYMAHVKGAYDRAGQCLRESMAIYEENQDRWGLANAMNSLSLVARRQGAFAQAKHLAQDALSVRREIGDLRGMASSLSNLGLIHCDLGEYAAAKDVLQEALQIFGRLGYQVGIANVLAGLCQAAFRLGEVEAAERFGWECLEDYREVGDRWGIAIAYNNLGRMAAEQGRQVEAKPLYLKAVDLYRRVGVQSGLANTLGNLGELCCTLGANDEAMAYLGEALQIASEAGALPAALKALVVYATLLRGEGELRPALSLLAFVLNQTAVARDIQGSAEGLFGEMSAGLSPEEVAAVEAEGRCRTLEEIVREVLDRTA